MQTTAVDLQPPRVGDEVETKLHAMLGERTGAARRYGPAFERFWSTAVDRLRGGKLMRPRLLVEVFDALLDDRAARASTPMPSSAPRAEALRVAAAVEVLHFSFLLHDDVIDQDLVRRGSLNFIGQVHEEAKLDEATRTAEPAEPHGAGADAGPALAAGAASRMHWARNCGILAGDLMLAIAHQVFARVETDGATRTRLLDLLDETVTETVAGEHADIGLAQGVISPDLDAVLEMTGRKTAAYTFELPLRAAAILAGSDARLEHRFAAIGRSLGLAYQLQDDLLSAFGRADDHGKDDASDFREGKQTPLIVLARETPAWPEIRELLEVPEPTRAAVDRIRELLRACGAGAVIESMIRDETGSALAGLEHDDGLIPARVAEHVRALAAALDGRIA